MVRLSVRNRIFAMIMGVGTVIFILLLAAVYTHTTQAFKESIGEGLHRIAQQMASRIDLEIAKEVASLRVLAQQEVLVAALEEANSRYRGLTAEQVQRRIDGIEREWPTSQAYRHLYTPGLNPTAELMARHQSLNPSKMAELFVTDLYGALVASTNRTSDYWQADERWWQSAAEAEEGSAYVGNLEFDESAQVYALGIGLPVKDPQGGKTLGVIKAVVDVHELLGLLAGFRLGETGHIRLVDSSGTDILRRSEMPNLSSHSFEARDVGEALRSPKTHTVLEDSEKDEFIVGLAPVKSAETFGPDTFGGKSWYVLVTQELGEAYEPVYMLMETLLVLGLVAMVALYLTVFLTARTITIPLDRLRRGTQRVRDGELDQQVELSTGDELQDLAESFNEMTERLRVSYEELRERTCDLEQSLDALGQSEARYRSVLETSRSGILVADEEGRFSIFNPSFAEMLGYDVEEMKRLTLSDFVHPDELSGVERRLVEHMEGKLEPTAFEIRCNTKQDREIIAEVSQGPYSPAGKVIGVIWELRDITKRKQAEEELREAHEELKGAYRALEMAQAAAIVAEKLAALGRLTAGVSHEILNPLNIITMRLYMMLRDPNTPREIVGTLQVLEEQANRISKIIKELLYFARQRPPDRRPTDINDIMRRTLNLVGPDLRIANIQPEFDLHEGLPLVSADQDQIQQVMLNLLSNAQEAMPQGGRLLLQTEDVKAAGRRWVELRVEDSGEGIDPADHDKLFEPFFTTKPEGEGNGLGLAICKGIIDSHGGSIWAENSPDRGAAFIVRLEAEA